eukprot:m.31324 g.31324  ORF g.31324 m.31324 type:complete len:516 (+) comp31480_c0_seq6:14-1561(+)
MEVEALYDFQPASDVELAFHAGERLLVVRQDVGEGWWEGRKMDDQKTGLFPATYVKVVDELPPPPPPYEVGVVSGIDSLPPPPASVVGVAPSATGDLPQQSFACGFEEFSQDVNPETFSDHLKRESSFARPSVANFTSFTADSQGMSGLLNPQHKCRIIVGPTWQSSVQPLKLKVSNPQKDSKYGGIKQFITYEVTSDVTSEPVKRRYKHFLWLHDQLSELFPCVCIPPLPEKQFSGRFEEDFIRQRQHLLAMFINRVAQHPLLAAAHAFSHFLLASGEKEWKSAKRNVVRSLSFSRPQGKFVGPAYLTDIEYPIANVPHDRLVTVERFTKYRDCLERNVKGLSISCSRVCAASSALSTAYGCLGQSALSLATGDGFGESAGTSTQSQHPKEVQNWCWRKDCLDFATLMQSFHLFGMGLEEIKALAAKQNEETVDTMSSTLKEYVTLLPWLTVTDHSSRFSVCSTLCILERCSTLQGSVWPFQCHASAQGTRNEGRDDICLKRRAELSQRSIGRI